MTSCCSSSRAASLLCPPCPFLCIPQCPTHLPRHPELSNKGPNLDAQVASQDSQQIRPGPIVLGQERGEECAYEYDQVGCR